MNATEETIKFTSDYYGRTYELSFRELYCELCQVLEWHLLKNDGTWECLGCRSK